MAAQFSIVSADVASPEIFRRPINPVDVSMEPLDEKRWFITINVARRIDCIEDYTCKVYRVNDKRQIFEYYSIFDEDVSSFSIYYSDLDKDTPYNLILEFEFNFDKNVRKLNKRPLLNKVKYELCFERVNDELKTQLVLID